MQANLSKFQGILIPRGIDITPVTFDGADISISIEESVKILGVHIADKRKCDSHTSENCKTAPRHLNAISFVPKCLDERCMVSLYHSFILSHFKHALLMRWVMNSTFSWYVIISIINVNCYSSNFTDFMRKKNNGDHNTFFKLMHYCYGVEVATLVCKIWMPHLEVSFTVSLSCYEVKVLCCLQLLCINFIVCLNMLSLFTCVDQ